MMSQVSKSTDHCGGAYSSPRKVGLSARNQESSAAQQRHQTPNYVGSKMNSKLGQFRQLNEIKTGGGGASAYKGNATTGVVQVSPRAGRSHTNQGQYASQ